MKHGCCAEIYGIGWRPLVYDFYMFLDRYFLLRDSLDLYLSGVYGFIKSDALSSRDSDEYRRITYVMGLYALLLNNAGFGGLVSGDLSIDSFVVSESRDSLFWYQRMLLDLYSYFFDLFYYGLDRGDFDSSRKLDHLIGFRLYRVPYRVIGDIYSSISKSLRSKIGLGNSVQIDRLDLYGLLNRAIFIINESSKLTELKADRRDVVRVEIANQFKHYLERVSGGSQDLPGYLDLAWVLRGVLPYITLYISSRVSFSGSEGFGVFGLRRIPNETSDESRYSVFVYLYSVVSSLCELCVGFGGLNDCYFCRYIYKPFLNYRLLDALNDLYSRGFGDGRSSDSSNDLYGEFLKKFECISYKIKSGYSSDLYAASRECRADNFVEMIHSHRSSVSVDESVRKDLSLHVMGDLVVLGVAHRLLADLIGDSYIDDTPIREVIANRDVLKDYLVFLYSVFLGYSGLYAVGPLDIVSGDISSCYSLGYDASDPEDYRCLDLPGGSGGYSYTPDLLVLVDGVSKSTVFVAEFSLGGGSEGSRRGWLSNKIRQTLRNWLLFSLVHYGGGVDSYPLLIVSERLFDSNDLADADRFDDGFQSFEVPEDLCGHLDVFLEHNLGPMTRLAVSSPLYNRYTIYDVELSRRGCVVVVDRLVELRTRTCVGSDIGRGSVAGGVGGYRDLVSYGRFVFGNLEKLIHDINSNA